MDKGRILYAAGKRLRFCCPTFSVSFSRAFTSVFLVAAAKMSGRLDGQVKD